MKEALLKVMAAVVVFFGVLFLFVAIKELVIGDFVDVLLFSSSFTVLIPTTYVIFTRPKLVYGFLTSLEEVLHGFVLEFFKNVNRKIRSELSIRRMEKETTTHIRLLIKAFKWIVLPSSFLYLSSYFYLQG